MEYYTGSTLTYYVASTNAISLFTFSSLYYAQVTTQTGKTSKRNGTIQILLGGLILIHHVVTTEASSSYATYYFVKQLQVLVVSERNAQLATHVSMKTLTLESGHDALAEKRNIWNLLKN